MKYIKRIHILCSIACFGLNQNLFSESVRHTQMTLFVREYPEFVQAPTNFQDKKNKFTHPSYPHEQKIKALIDPEIANGIFAMYAGFLVLSAPDGQISFPLKQDKPIVYLVITTRVSPIMMNSTTVHHWELEEKTPVSIYKIERKNDDGSDMYYWEVTQEPTPKNGIIPLNSILIFANPEYIYVPTGIVLAQNSPNLHLPDIYVKPGINKLSNALYVLYLKHFFGPVRRALKKEKTPHYAVRLTS